MLIPKTKRLKYVIGETCEIFVTFRRPNYEDTPDIERARVTLSPLTTFVAEQWRRIEEAKEANAPAPVTSRGELVTALDDSVAKLPRGLVPRLFESFVVKVENYETEDGPVVDGVGLHAEADVPLMRWVVNVLSGMTNITVTEGKDSSSSSTQSAASARETTVGTSPAPIIANEVGTSTSTAPDETPKP